MLPQERPARLPRCPECGWDTSQPARNARPPALQWRRTLIAAWVLLLLGLLLIVLGRASYRSTFRFGVWSPRVLLPPVTLADVQRLAAGDAAPDARGLAAHLLSAADQFRPDVSRNWELEVGFSTSTLPRAEVRSFGWPTPLVLSRRYPVFADAVRATSPKPAKTDPKARALGLYEFPSDLQSIPRMPRWQWQGHELQYHPPPEETGGVFQTLSLRPGALAAPIALLLCLWFLLTIPLRSRERRQRPTRLARRLRLACIFSAAIVLLALAAFRAQHVEVSLRANPGLTQVGAPGGPVYWTRRGFAKLKLDRAAVQQMADHPHADRQLARAILDAAPIPTGSPDTLYLAVVSDPDVLLDRPSNLDEYCYSFPVLAVQREYYVRRPDFGEPVPVPHPAGIRFSVRQDMATLVFPARDASQPTIVLAANLESIAMIILALWALGWLAWFVLIGSLSLRSRRRHRRGLCPQCGYALTSAP